MPENEQVTTTLTQLVPIPVQVNVAKYSGQNDLSAHNQSGELRAVASGSKPNPQWRARPSMDGC